MQKRQADEKTSHNKSTNFGGVVYKTSGATMPESFHFLFVKARYLSCESKHSKYYSRCFKGSGCAQEWHTVRQ